MAGQRNKNAFIFLLHLLILSQNIFWALRKWFGVVWWWFGANMAGQRNKNAFKFLLHLLILSQNIFWALRKWFGVV